MALLDLGEFLDRGLVVHVVKVVEGGGVERVGGPEGDLLTLERKFSLLVGRIVVPDGRFQQAYKDSGQQAQPECDRPEQRDGGSQKLTSSVYPRHLIDAEPEVSINNLCTVRVILSLSVRQDTGPLTSQRHGNLGVAERPLWSRGCDRVYGTTPMSDLVHDTQHEFWRPPAAQPAAEPVLADACRRCGTEFMVGAAFCHICGTNRHRAGASPAQELDQVFCALPHDRSWRGQELAWSAAAFALRVSDWGRLPDCGLAVGLMSVHDYSDFEAIQLWRIQWLLAACAAFLAGILLKKPEAGELVLSRQPVFLPSLPPL